MHRAIVKVLKDLRVEANISKQILLDVIIHWGRDMKRIESAQSGDGSATKHIAHQAFWIRKLKPISNAYPQDEMDSARLKRTTVRPTKEIVDINERVAIALACKALLLYVEKGIFFDVNLATDKALDPPPGADVSRMRAFLKAYFREKISQADGTIYDNLLYSMRYRTFGPHHMTQILDQAVFGSIYTK